MSKRFLHTLRPLYSHENPLGLPRKGAPPNIPRAQRGLPQKRSIRNVKHVVAVSSAKGGVGKSTIAANLALSFARIGHTTGILDTDIFGPSIPTLFNLSDLPEPPRLTSSNQLIPVTNYGVQTMSMGYLLPNSNAEESAVVWRGLMVMKALQQLLHEVAWGSVTSGNDGGGGGRAGDGGSGAARQSRELDVLVLDLPPGTGDTQLTIAQQVVLSGALLVSTPQSLALSDTLKGLGMFRKTNVDVLGIVRNMAGFACPKCGEVTPVFDSGRNRTKQARDGENAAAAAQDENDSQSDDGGSLEAKARKHNLDILADIPLDPSICSDADQGRPTVVADPEGARAVAFMQLAREVGGRIGLAS
ncbi:MAG: hypothetical protein M1831_003709 [Alyxoria varia]|nr:MAG: hypothetical protein M1831_003709 [Alyxoria varia]